MNKIYRLVWNRALRTMQVASELVRRPRGRGVRQSPGSARLAVAALGMAISMALLSNIAAASTTDGTATGGTGTSGGTVSTTTSPAAGAGGSAGVNGPTAGVGNLAGAAGTSPGGNGGDGGQYSTSSSGAGGGGGGANDGTSFSSSAQTGGSGGMGGWNGYTGGGGGGGGGIGVLLQGASGALTSNGTITGGRGGDGGITTGYAPRGGGGGGAGGTGLYLSTGTANSTVTIAAAITGGAGGTGGASGGGGGSGFISGTGGSSSGAGGAGTSNTSGGGGGGGGAGVSFNSTAGVSTTLLNTSTITGGRGGNGGLEAGNNGNGGNAGSGGVGVSLSGIHIGLINEGSIVGGNGGTAGECGHYCLGSAGTSAAGGAGVTADGNDTITTSGSISGGLSGDGFTRADAVDLSGGGNTLTLRAGYSFVGNVISTSGSTNGGDTLALDGSGTFNASAIVGFQPGSYYRTTLYSGFNSYEKTGNGTSTLTGTGNSNVNWTVTGGTMQGDATALVGDITFAPAIGETATVVFDQGSGNTNSPATKTYTGTISGNGSLTKIDDGTLVLTGLNTYAGGTTISGGTLQIGNGGTAGSITGNVIDNGSLAFDRSDAVNFAGVLSGTGTLTQTGSGTLTLDDNSSGFAGSTTVAAGTLVVGSAAGNGAALGGNVTVDANAMLRGHGTIGGNVDVQSGGIVTPGDSIGTLTVSGDFTAAQGSQMDFAFGAPGANFQTAGTGDSVTVGGNLTLDGATLNVTDADGMGPGLYKIFSYGGTLTETHGGIALGTTPSGQSLFLQNLTAQKQINLIDTTGYTVDAWNANGLATSTQMGGGSGTWSATSQGWTDATGTVPNGPMSPQPNFAVFGGAPGTVTVDDSAGSVSATGIQFATNGYTLDGGTLTLVANGGVAPVIRVGDGSSAGTGMTATIDSVIAGSAGLTKADLGTLVLTGTNTYTGGTTISAGTLQVGNGGTTGAITGNVTDNGTLAFDRSDATSFAGVVSGSGSLVQNGSGTLTLTGANTYSGGTTINAGTLQVGNGGTTGAITGNITDNGTLAFDRSDAASFTGVVSGNGVLTQLGSGTETLTNANTYTGVTTIASGTLALSGNGSIASSSDVIANGTFDISGTAAGASIASLDGSGTVTLGSQTLTLTNAAGTFGGVLGGAGRLALASGTEILTGANTYSGGTTINAGTLQVGKGGTTGAITGNVTDNGTLAFDRSDAASFAGVVSGSGSLVQNGSGTLTLAGANTYAGGTTISAGTLVVDSTTLPGAVTDNAALVFDQAGNGTFNGAISGNGSVAKTGARMLILDGNSGAFAGSTRVQSGTLEVGDAGTPSAALGGNVTVASGGTLRGHGTIGGNVSNSGTLWAGGSIGTLTIQGNYTQAASGVFEVEATPNGQASLLSVGGTATLAGTALVLADTGTWARRTDYTVLTAAGGVSGQFASASVNLPFLTPVLSYAANAVTLSLERNDINFNAVVQTPNQQAVATAANPLGFGNPVYDALVVLDAPTARHAFDQLSGEIHASTRTAIADDDHYVRDAINQHLAGQDNDANGLNVTDASGVTAWTSVWGHWGSHDGDGNAADLASNGSGFLVGADLPVGATARLGAVLGTGQGTARIATQGASSHIIDQHLGVYAGLQSGALQWQGAAIYGWQKVDTNRFVGFGTFNGSAVSSYHAHTAQAYVDASLPFVHGSTTLAPFANLAMERLSMPAITEHGTPAALNVAPQDSTLGYGTLGLRATFDLGAPSHGLHAHASLGWQHAWGDTLPVGTMRFESGSDSFAIAGLPVAKNAGVFNAGISFTIAPNVSADCSYQGRFGQHASDQSARISLDWTF